MAIGVVTCTVFADAVERYEKKHGDPPSAVSRHEIPVSEIEDCLKWQGTTLRQGDILCIRSG